MFVCLCVVTCRDSLYVIKQSAIKSNQSNHWSSMYWYGTEWSTVKKGQTAFWMEDQKVYWYKIKSSTVGLIGMYWIRRNGLNHFFWRPKLDISWSVKTEKQYRPILSKCLFFIAKAIFLKWKSNWESLRIETKIFQVFRANYFFHFKKIAFAIKKQTLVQKGTILFLSENLAVLESYIIEKLLKPLTIKPHSAYRKIPM